MTAPNSTNVMFKGEWKTFPSQITAYRWIFQRFLTDRPDIPKDPHKWSRIVNGRTRNYAGKTGERLCPATPHLDDRAMNVTIDWIVHTVMSEKMKLKVLEKFAGTARYTCGTDWDWDSGSGKLSTKQAELILPDL